MQLDFKPFYVLCCVQSLPFGGTGDSGFGKFGGIEGLRGLCNMKAVVEDRFGFLKTQIPRPLQVRSLWGSSVHSKLLNKIGCAKACTATGLVRGIRVHAHFFFSHLILSSTLPLPLQYPVATNAVAFQQALVRLLYGTSLQQRVGGLLALLKESFASGS